MATYEGRLTQCYTDGLEGNGPFVCRRGRYYGGVKFFGDRWTAFEECDADMSAVDRGVGLGHLEIRKVPGGKRSAEKETEPARKATSGKGRGRGSSRRRGKQ